MKLELKDDDGRLIYSWYFVPFDDPPMNIFDFTSMVSNCIMDHAQLKDQEPTDVYNEYLEEGKNDTNQ